jgi:hypothetical protein
VGSTAALGEGLEDRFQDDQRESGDADREARLPWIADSAPLPDPCGRLYEWTVGNDGKKQPIHFHLPAYEMFFAGLWTSRTDEETGDVIESCTIITT